MIYEINHPPSLAVTKFRYTLPLSDFNIETSTAKYFINLSERPLTYTFPPRPFLNSFLLPS